MDWIRTQLRKSREALASVAPGKRVRGLLGDSAWQFGETGFRVVIGLFVGALVARHLSTAGFGVLSYAVAVVGFVVPLSRLGLDSIVARDVAAHPERSAALIAAVLRVTLVSGLCGMLLVLSFAFLGDHGAVLRMGLAVASIAGLTTSLGVFQGVLKANFHAGALSRFRVVIAMVFALGRVGVVYADGSVSAFIAMLVLEEAASHGVAYLLCRKHGLLTKPAAGETVRIGPLLAEGFPLMLSFVLIAFYSRIDVIMIQAIRGVQETGLYAAATRVSEVWHMIPGIMVGTFLPHFAQIRTSDPERFLRTIRAFAAMFFWGSCAVILVTTVAAPYFVGFLFGGAFSAAVPMVKIHVWCFIAVCLGGLLGYWYILEKLNHFLIIASAAGLTANIVLNFLLIPRYGGAGAAAATAISYTLSVLAPILVSSRARQMGATVLRGICLRIN